MPYGTLTTLDTLATLDNQTVADYGEDKVWSGIEAALAGHNDLLMAAIGDLVDDTTDRLRRYGGGDNGEMDEVDEMGRADAQKLTAGSNVAFPLRKFQRTKQWSRNFFEEVTPGQLVAEFNGDMDADVRRVYREIRRAVYNPTNYTFIDKEVDQVSLAVKALVNADGADLPPGQQGFGFDGATHTHYLYTPGTTLAAASVDALLETVLEHFGTGELILEIARAQETTIRALPGFVPYPDPRTTTGANLTVGNEKLDLININNRAIGVYGSAEVQVKRRAVPGYLFAWMRGAQKTLAYRRPLRNPARGNFRLVADNEVYPLRAQTRERMFGISVSNRVNGAVLFIDAGGAGAYVAPTIL